MPGRLYVGCGVPRDVAVRARKVRVLTTRVYEFSALAVNNRIQAELLRIARLASQQDRSVQIVGLPTHAEVASRVSTHREAATRKLNRLSRLGIIERRAGALVIKDVDRIRARDGLEHHSEDLAMMNVPQQHSDQAFPYVLVISTLGAILSLGSGWIAALPIA